MHIIYPYNEILPTRRAHDVYIFQECAAFAASGIQTTLLIGQGSWSDEELCHYYLKSKKPPLLSIERLPIIRKNNPFNISWNRLFFHCAAKFIQGKAPDYVILSVSKLAAYLIKHRVASTRYLYEVHELSYYPGAAITEAVMREAELLSQMDLVVTTTSALKEIVERAPYSLKNPCCFVPLGVCQAPLPEVVATTPLRLAYVGQLYQQQGVEILLRALAQTERILLQIIGGTREEIKRLQKIAANLRLAERVTFTGFLPPTVIEEKLSSTHLFVAPFEEGGKMPYVAHTKLLCYAAWQRPFIAPYAPAVLEHFGDDDAALFFQAQDLCSLVETLQQAACPQRLQSLLDKARTSSKNFSWHTRIKRYQQLLQPPPLPPNYPQSTPQLAIPL